MTMSPKYSPFTAAAEPRRSRTGLRRAAEGNESTSVGPFFFRNVSFIRAISASLTRQTVTPASSKPSSFFTRRRNDSSGRRARRTARWRFTIILAGFLYLVLSRTRSEEHTSELQSLAYLVCRLLLEKKKKCKHLD